MRDLIDRQATIDALGEEPEVWDDDDEYGMGQRSEWCHIKKIIEKLQSAQPQRGNQKTALSVQVKVDFDDMKVLLDDIGKLQTYKLFVGDDMVLVDIEDIKDILAKHVKAKEVQSQRNTGKWINHRKDDGHNIADCDQCGNAIQWFDGDEIPRYCCMCGARMDGESE